MCVWLSIFNTGENTILQYLTFVDRLQLSTNMRPLLGRYASSYPSAYYVGYATYNMNIYQRVQSNGRSIIFVVVKSLGLIVLTLLPLFAKANGYQLFEENGKKGIKNEQGQVIIPPSFEALGWSDGSFSVIGNVTGYRIGHSWGVINLKKEFVTKAEYETLVYAGGDNIIARKKISPVAVKVGTLNLQGENKIPFVYDGIQINGLRAIVFNLVNGKFWYGLTDFQNNVLLPVSFKNIFSLGTLRFAVQNPQNKMALYNEQGRAVTDFSIDSISSFYKGYAIIYENLLQGLMDREGQIKLKPIYQSIKINAEGKIFARLPSEWVWLTPKNEIVKKFMADSLQPLANGHQLVTRGDKMGVVDKDFKIVIPIVYQKLQPTNNGFIAEKNGKLGAITLQEKEVVPFIYDHLEAQGNLFEAFTTSIGWQLVNENNVVVTDKYYQSISKIREEGFLVTHRNYAGWLDNAGKEVVHCVYDSIISMKDNLVSVKFRGQYGIIDKNDRWVVPPQVYPIQLISSTHYLLKQPGQSFLKTIEGQIIYFTPNKTSFEKDYWLEHLPNGGDRKISYEGIALPSAIQPQTENVQYVFKESEGFRGVQKDGKFGFVDAKGKLRIANRYDSIGDFHEGLAAIKLIGKWGFLNAQDKIAVHPNYEWVDRFNGGVCIAKQRGKFGMIDATGKAILEFRYDAINRLPNGQLEIVANQKKGRASAEGKIEIETRFNYLAEVENGSLIASQEGLFGVVDRHGLSVVPLNYSALIYQHQPNLYLGLQKNHEKEIFLGQ